tara:strand:- start:1188 stop:1388 length:201 start_codon:yes stop_codon:yes gene_type:complete
MKKKKTMKKIMKEEKKRRTKKLQKYSLNFEVILVVAENDHMTMLDHYLDQRLQKVTWEEHEEDRVD